MLQRASCTRLIPRICISHLSASNRSHYRHSAQQSAVSAGQCLDCLLGCDRRREWSDYQGYLLHSNRPTAGALCSPVKASLSSSYRSFTIASMAGDTAAVPDQTPSRRGRGQTRKTTAKGNLAENQREAAALESTSPTAEGRASAEVDAHVGTKSETPAKGVKRGRGVTSTPSSQKKAKASEIDAEAAEQQGQEEDVPKQATRGKRGKRADEQAIVTKKKTTTRKTKTAVAAVVEDGDEAAVAVVETNVAETNTTKEPAAKSKGRKKKEAAPPPPVYSYEMRPPPYDGPAFRVLSWNVAGIRAMMKKAPSAVKDLVTSEQADVLCIQEVKAGDDVDKTALAQQLGLPDWHWCWCCGETKGYSGVTIASREKPIRMWCDIDIAEHDKEGRVVTAEFPDLFVVNVYVPNSGEGLKRLDYRVKSWDTAFSAYLKGLEAKGKPVVLTGDMNCAHKEIDIHSPKTNLRSAGFTQEERDSFEACYIQNGFIDTWREQHPGVVGYTYWTYKFNCRAKNKGWRLDYYLVSSSLKDRIHDSYIKYDVMGSDHCPIGLILKH